MKIKFYKYQGTGNDFVMIDNRVLQLPRVNTELVKHLCDRRFGIGGDGLIYLQDKKGYDFEMVYYNSDGRESTMCGNGGRCIVQFAHDLGLRAQRFSFLAADGPHAAEVLPDGLISLQMKDVKIAFRHGEDYILDTGSPHIVHFVQDIKNYPVAEQGREIRYSERFRDQGINVNFAEITGRHSIYVRTYERGVEDETLSCGTGVVASGIAFYYHSPSMPSDIEVETPGGMLKVRFSVSDQHLADIHLTGPAKLVYSGEIHI